MRDTVYTSAAAGESCREIVHPSGLTIRVLHKDGYKSSFAMFATKYGSIDTRIRQADGTFRTIPEGTAHFLEHKLFESEEQDAFARFAQTGASANAFTSFETTVYLFSCTDRFEENLEILLDFVQSPYFTEETVRKEQGIIGQEIRMYKDSAGWESKFNLLHALYLHHPVQIDIAGTEQTIAQITAELLHGCYRNFYNLGNMVLCVAGSATVEQVLAVADRALKSAGGEKAVREYVPEPPEVRQTLIEEKLSVKTPTFALGFKEAIDTPERGTKQVLCMDILLDAIAGKSSALYRALMQDGLINQSFYSDYFYGFGFAECEFGGESADPIRTAARIREALREIKRTGISAESFECARRRKWGRMIMMFNDVEDIAMAMTESYFRGEGLFDSLELCRTLTLDDVNAYLACIPDEACSALSVIWPREGETA